MSAERNAYRASVKRIGWATWSITVVDNSGHWCSKWTAWTERGAWRSANRYIRRRQRFARWNAEGKTKVIHP